jgi:F-type H+-transporting ATPase subunit epsilon
MTLTVHIITPEKALPPRQADHVTVPASEGDAGIRTGHAPYVAQLRNGRLFVKSATNPDESWAVRGGVVQVYKDEVKILTEGATPAAEVSEKDLLVRLEKLLAATYEDPIEKVKAKAEAQWIVSQLTVAGKTTPDIAKMG